ncbi:MAG: hypothetical protein AMK73_06770 [Planctomycetes bacterium SM23_32]|nr:MAG: hypothetical protein AMK73_06770 [Planctomycetes bacterium SM23_32]
MDENRKKVLEMLSEGKITVEEADRLLDRLEGAAAAASEPAGTVGGVDMSVKAAERPVPQEPRFLRVLVDSASGDKVNVRVPMALIRTGIKLKALLPEHAREAMEDHGLDLSALSELDPDEIITALAELTVDVDSQSGDAVRIFCE